MHSITVVKLHACMMQYETDSLVAHLHIAGSAPIFFAVFILFYMYMYHVHWFCSNQVVYRSYQLLLMLRLDAAPIHVVHNVVHIHVAKGSLSEC
jgi:hypothetical protein